MTHVYFNLRQKNRWTTALGAGVAAVTESKYPVSLRGKTAMAVMCSIVIMILMNRESIKNANILQSNVHTVVHIYLILFLLEQQVMSS